MSWKNLPQQHDGTWIDDLQEGDCARGCSGMAFAQAASWKVALGLIEPPAAARLPLLCQHPLGADGLRPC